MKWTALPVEGGLYDQHPQLLDEWEIIFYERNVHQERERRKEDAKNKQSGAQRRPTR